VKVKSILISQPEPSNGRSPYYELKDKFNVKIDFKPFIQVECVEAKEFRRNKIDILAHSAIVMTSRTAIEHFFRICDEMRIEVPAEMKYFCVTEAVALYLQKFITYRKRKVFFPKTKDKALKDLVNKHKKEKFLLPCSVGTTNNELVEYMIKQKIAYTIAPIYRTVSNDLSDLQNVDYDILAFFSPSGIESLMDNFPDFQQDETKIAAFGPKTCKKVKETGLDLDIQAPTLQAPSMKMALEHYIRRSHD